MSRIILSRHDNGEERITVGYDRPLQHYFWSECDNEGEGIDESYMDRGLVLTEVDDFFLAAATHNDAVYNAMQAADDAHKLGTILKEHKALEYPASNVTIDLSTKE